VCIFLTSRSCAASWSIPLFISFQNSLLAIDLTSTQFMVLRFIQSLVVIGLTMTKANVSLCLPNDMVVITTGVVFATEEARLLYIGGDAILQFSSNGGNVRVLQLEREAIGKCDPFPTRFVVDEHNVNGLKLSYIGGGHLLRTNVVGQSFDILSCQFQQSITQGTHHSSLSCNKLMNGTQEFLGKVTYIESDKIVDFNATTGDYILRSLRKNAECSIPFACGFQSIPLAAGNLKDLCSEITGSDSSRIRYDVIGSGTGQAMIVCKGKSSFVGVNIYPTVTQKYSFELSISRTGQLPNFAEMISLGGSLIMGYSPFSLDFQILDCSDETCKKVAQGSLATGVNIHLHC
jgi:hypothetical protein